MFTEPQQIWYASYGSNLRGDRFFTYLKGGLPPKMEETTPQHGSRNPKLPANDWHETVGNWQVTFRGKKSRWGVGGVAYLEPRQTQKPLRPPAQLRLWLIEFNQYVDVYLQENGINPKLLPPSQMQAVEKWLSDTVHQDDGGTLFVPDDLPGMPETLLKSTYRRVIRLNDRNEVPVFSFTSPDDDGVFTAPSTGYVHTIGVGLLETFPDSSVQEMTDYLSEVTMLPNIKTLAAQAVEQYLAAAEKTFKTCIKEADRSGCSSNKTKESPKPSMGPFRVAPTQDRTNNRREFIAQLPACALQNIGLKKYTLVALSSWHKGKEYRVLATLTASPADTAPTPESDDKLNSATQTLYESTILIDQKLRVALGARKGDFIGLCQLDTRKRRSHFEWFIEGLVRTQPQIMRVQITSFEDMEIDIARIPAGTFDIIGVEPGNTVTISSTIARKRVRSGILTQEQMTHRNGQIKRDPDYFIDPIVALELHRMLGGTSEEDLPTIFIDYDMRQALGIKPMQPVRIVRDSLDIAMSRVYLILTPVALGLIATVVSIKEISWVSRLLLFALLSVLAVGVVILEARSKFQDR